MSPNGAYKILKKLEEEEILQYKQVANVKSYSLLFASPKTKLVLQLAFMENVSPEIMEKLAVLRPFSDLCFLNPKREAVAVANVSKPPKIRGIKVRIVAKEAFLAERESLESALLIWGHDKLMELFSDAAGN